MMYPMITMVPVFRGESVDESCGQIYVIANVALAVLFCIALVCLAVMIRFLSVLPLVAAFLNSLCRKCHDGFYIKKEFKYHVLIGVPFGLATFLLQLNEEAKKWRPLPT